MGALRSMMSGLKALFGREKRNAELEDELRGFSMRRSRTKSGGE